MHNTKRKQYEQLASITELYKGINTDLIEELTAELARDYIFNEDFVNQLTQDKIAFQKMYAHIKEWLKAVDSGSDEYKQIYEVQKLLEQALKNSERKQDSEKAKCSLIGYDDHQIKNWSKSKFITIYENDQQLLNFLSESRKGHNSGKKMYFGMIPSILANRIIKETGVNVENFNCSLQSDEVRKIFKDHGNEEIEWKRGQRAITEDDFLSIPTVIQEADTIRLSPTNHNRKPVIEFVKEWNGRTTIIAYVSDKPLDLSIKTMYSGRKKGNLATAIDEQASINTSQATGSTVPTDSIRSDDKKGQEKFSLDGINLKRVFCYKSEK